MTKQNALVKLLLAVLMILSFVRYFEDTRYWVIDIFSHFPVQYALLALLLLAVYLWKKKVTLAVFAGLLFAFNISVLVDSGRSAQAAGKANKSFKVYAANINESNRDFSKLVGGLTETGADILLLLEVTEKNIKPLQSLIRTYPYRIINLNTGASGTGLVLMSKFSIINHEVIKYSEFGNMLVSAMLEIHNKKVIFHATHFPKPTSIQEFPVRTKQILSLAKRIREQSIPVIVAGDFNATPFSPTFKQLVKISGLRDSRTGFGWLPSWPTYFPLFWLPIDHILVSPGIQVHNRNTGSHIGSDHYPVVAELSMDR